MAARAASSESASLSSRLHAFQTLVRHTHDGSTTKESLNTYLPQIFASMRPHTFEINDRQHYCRQ
eukprot:COSAG06_NODE_30959_length_529_cov_1.023256_1_plen_64_part_10